ncbi:hypothetical protein ASPZODRAFT_135544, partial [Penicilliopsis zonata CBS 506.65]
MHILTLLSLATAISAQTVYIVAQCNTNATACQTVGVPCNNGYPYRCPVEGDEEDYFGILCRDANAYPQIIESGLTLEQAEQVAGCR